MTSTALDLNHGTPATALAIRPGQQAWDDMQLAALTQLGIKDASDGDKAVFLHQCQRTGLDPFARQIYMIGRNEKKNEKRNGQWVEVWSVKWTIQTGIDGWRVIRSRAERRENVRVQVGRAIWYDHDGSEHKVWVRRDPPAACEITITVRDVAGNETPYTSVLYYAEYVQTKESNGEQRPIALWASKPAHMLEKCTEADVYRKAFPQDFSGMYLDDAMPPDTPDVNGAQDTRPRGRVTAGEIVERGPAQTGTQAPPQTVRRETAAAGNGGPAPDPAGAGQPDPPPCEDDADTPPPPRATTGQLSMLGHRLGKLGVADENRLSTLEKLAGHDLSEPAELTQDQAAHIKGLLDRCNGDRGALVELLATGQLPETEKAGDGDG